MTNPPRRRPTVREQWAPRPGETAGERIARRAGLVVAMLVVAAVGVLAVRVGVAMFLIVWRTAYW